ncbi:hypothetical protein EON80_23955 [bacterium]|nr:MAG: hypothetical protein EON80_23955 [bacterium]
MKQPWGCLKIVAVVPLVLIVAVFARYKWSNISPAVSFPTPLPTPSSNGFDLYVKAAKLIDPGRLPVDEVYDREALNLTPAEKAQRYSLRRKQEWLTTNAAGFNLMRQALAAQARHPDTRGQLTPMVEYGKMRELARYKVVESKTLQQEKRWRAAVEARLDVMEMGGDIMRGGGLIAGLVGIACEAIALNEFDPLVAHLNATECRQVNARLEKILAARPLFSEIMTEEKYSSQQMLLNQWARIDQGDVQEKDEDEDAAEDEPDLFSVNAQFWLSMLVSRRKTIANNEKLLNQVIAESDKPLRQRQPVPPPSKYFDVVNFIIYPVMDRALFNSTRSLAGPQRQQLRLALREYRLEKGTYPPSLQQLVPGYLKKLPIDPYGSGQIWHYKKLNDSYRAWSIGPDGKDNDGTPILLKKGKTRVVIWTDSLGDVVARP